MNDGISWMKDSESWRNYEVLRVYDDGRPSDLIAVFNSEVMAFDYVNYLSTVGIQALVRPDFLSGRAS